MSQILNKIFIFTYFVKFNRWRLYRFFFFAFYLCYMFFKSCWKTILISIAFRLKTFFFEYIIENNDICYSLSMRLFKNCHLMILCHFYIYKGHIILFNYKSFEWSKRLNACILNNWTIIMGTCQSARIVVEPLFACFHHVDWIDFIIFFIHKTKLN